MTEKITEKNQPLENHQTLQGWIPELTHPAQLLDALEKAFDYRGDVSLTLRCGSIYNGYIFDRHTGQGLDDSHVQLLPADSNKRIKIAYSEITRLEFIGKDTAAGKTWENWLKRYTEQKNKGESADLFTEDASD